MRQFLVSVVVAVAAFAVNATAQVIENFEHGNEGLWAQQTAGDNMTLLGAAARNGNFGAQFASGSSGWRTRFDLATSPGNQYIAYVRTRGPANNIGRVYLGVGATAAGGTWSAVFGPNTNQILLQNNTPTYGFVTAQSASFTFTANTWYVLMLDWAANGDMTVRLFDEAMTSLLASTPTHASGFTTPGGVALRGFTTTTTQFVDVDDISVIPAPAGLLVLAGLAPLARRRR